MEILHWISTSPRGGRPLVEAGLTLRVRDLRGRYGFFGSHSITAADGTVVKLRLEIDEVRGWLHAEHWPAGADWAMATYDIALLSTPQPFGEVEAAPISWSDCGLA